ncbi:signal peptidase II [Candidatus Woesearchaeota archaeon]|nr:signal peptidase II [Candidatus Woesearchaeota archaeon]
MKPTDKKKAVHIFFTALIILIADQLFKFLVLKTIPFQFSIQVIPNIFYLTYIRNYGAAFGLFQNASNLLLWFSVIVVGVILYIFNKIPKENFPQIMIGLVLGGTLGNLIDRIRFGYVIDFIDFRIWPAFNAADTAITIGVIGLIIYLIKKK